MFCVRKDLNLTFHGQIGADFLGIKIWILFEFFQNYAQWIFNLTDDSHFFHLQGEAKV